MSKGGGLIAYRSSFNLDTSFKRSSPELNEISSLAEQKFSEIEQDDT